MSSPGSRPSDWAASTVQGIWSYSCLSINDTSRTLGPLTNWDTISSGEPPSRIPDATAKASHQHLQLCYSFRQCVNWVTGILF